MIRVVQYWMRHPETGERVDVSYSLQMLMGESSWVDVPIVQVEVVQDDPKDHG